MITEIHPIFKFNKLETDADKTQFMVDLQLAIDGGAVESFKHPTKSYLTGFDYSRDCQTQKMWDEYPIARFCRGFVWNFATDSIAALPFPKFMNLGESGCDIDEKELMEQETVTADSKEDGSLSILFFDMIEKEWVSMTRGSFQSEQCKTAATWLETKENGNILDESRTYLSEIIYPNNRIVIDYGGYTGFICLGSYDKNTGEYRSEKTSALASCFKQSEYRDLQTKTIKFSDLKAMMPLLTSNEEGFVIRMVDGRRCKLKGEKYLAMHKAKFDLSPLSSWNALQTGTVDDVIKNLPEEFHPLLFSYLDSISKSFKKTFKEYTDQLVVVSKALAGRKYTKKEYAEEVLKLDSKYHGFCFAQYKDDPMKVRTEIVMQLVRPAANMLEVHDSP